MATNNFNSKAMTRAKASLLTAVLLLACVNFAQATDPKATDPLGSVAWDAMHKVYLDGEPVVFDEHVKVTAPSSAEDSTAVPVMVRVTGLDDVERIVVITDLNPIAKVLDFAPGEKLAPTIGFRVKVQQATPVRAAARTTDGIWHVGGVWLDASGGGCTVPSLASGNDDWAARLGDMRGRLWPSDTGQRLRLQVQHPMDTGLAPGIPAFYIEDLTIMDSEGKPLGSLKAYEPVSENPTFSFDLKTDELVMVSIRDNNGNKFGGRISQ